MFVWGNYSGTALHSTLAGFFKSSGFADSKTFSARLQKAATAISRTGTAVRAGAARASRISVQTKNELDNCLANTGRERACSECSLSAPCDGKMKDEIIKSTTRAIGLLLAWRTCYDRLNAAQGRGARRGAEKTREPRGERHPTGWGEARPFANGLD